MPQALLDATREPDVVAVPRRKVLAVDGHGPPGDAAFTASVGALYGVAYTLKFDREKSGSGRLQGGGHGGPLGGRRAGPAQGRAAQEHLAVAAAPRRSGRRGQGRGERIKAAVVAKKGGKLFGSAAVHSVHLEAIPAGRFGRILHVGPYADEPASFARVQTLLATRGLVGAPWHLEVYLGIPGRGAPSKLRTVLLREVARAGRGSSEPQPPALSAGPSAPGWTAPAAPQPRPRRSRRSGAGAASGETGRRPGARCGSRGGAGAAPAPRPRAASAR